MATPMVENLNSFVQSYSYLIDLSMYKQLTASLMYLVNTKIDICFAINTLSEYMLDPRKSNWVTTKHVLQ